MTLHKTLFMLFPMLALGCNPDDFTEVTVSATVDAGVVTIEWDGTPMTELMVIPESGIVTDGVDYSCEQGGLDVGDQGSVDEVWEVNCTDPTVAGGVEEPCFTDPVTYGTVPDGAFEQVAPGELIDGEVYVVTVNEYVNYIYGCATFTYTAQ